MMNEKTFVVPAATFRELPDEYELRIEVPGVGKEDADLHVDGRTLTLKTRAHCERPAGFRLISAEFERNNYAISADLPEMADLKTLAAKLENGILSVTVKKREETQPRAIPIG